MQVLPQCGHAVHEDAPEKVRAVYLNVHKEKQRETLTCPIKKTVVVMSHNDSVCKSGFLCFLQLSPFNPDLVCCHFLNF